MDYFWHNKDFVYDPNKNYLFSLYHISILLLVTIIGVLFWFIIKNKSKPKQTLILRIVGFILLLLEILRYINFRQIYNVTPIGALQFHLCSVGIYFAILATIFNKKWLYSSYIMHAFIGPPFALFYPMGILPWFNTFSFLALQSFISHMFLTWSIIIAYKLKIWEPSKKDYIFSISGVVVSYILAFIFSYYNLNNSTGGHQNFIWVRFPEENFPIIANWPFPYYLIAMFVGLVLTGCLIITIFIKKSKKPLNAYSY